MLDKLNIDLYITYDSVNVIWYEMKQGNVQLHRIKVLVHPDKWYSYSFSSYFVSCLWSIFIISNYMYYTKLI